MSILATNTILIRTDTGEYLSHFLFFDPESMTWTKDVNEAFSFRTHTDAECNARLILDRMHDPTNRRVGLKSAKAAVKDGKLNVSEWYAVNVCLVA
jgi:hypothetical protein